MSKIKFAIIGCQHTHISTFIQEMLDLNYECMGIYESENNKLASSISKQFNIPIIDNIDYLLGDQVDIIGCADINNKKIDIIELCEKNNKHIMVDKPLVTNRIDYERLESVIRRGRIQIGLLLTERFRPALYTLKKRIDIGDLGEIVHIGMRKPHRLSPSNRPHWFFSKNQCGGIVVDLFIHDFDLLRWLTGMEIDLIQGYMSKNILPEYPDFYDVANLLVKMKGNVIAELYGDWHTPNASWTWGDGRIFVTETKGFAELRLEGDPLIEEFGLMIQVTHELPPVKAKMEPNPSTVSQDFLNRINQEPHLITHNDILQATKATILADESVVIIHNQGGKHVRR